MVPRSVQEIRCLRGALRSDEVRARDCGSRFRGQGAKCLQACVDDGLRGAHRGRIGCVLRNCSNADGAGCAGTLRELRNFEMLRGALRAEHVFLYVYESKSMDALADGSVEGRWVFGLVGGSCVGALVWLRDEKHVVRLVLSEGVGSMDGCWCVSDAVAPWYRYVVGAPKMQVNVVRISELEGLDIRLGGGKAQWK